MKEDFENFQNGDDSQLKSAERAYKEAPGLYREWGMRIVNKVIAKLENEHPRLKTLRHNYKQVWVRDVVVLLVQQTEDSTDPITEEQLKIGEDKLMAFIEKRIRKFFEGEQLLDEFLWEQELEKKEGEV